MIAYKTQTVFAACALLVMYLLPACSSRQEYALTQQQKSFSEMNEAKRGTAPNVAASVTSERIARARSEPQNWLTYYGAYDGQRFSSLDQIDRLLYALELLLFVRQLFLQCLNALAQALALLLDCANPRRYRRSRQ